MCCQMGWIGCTFAGSSKSHFHIFWIPSSSRHEKCYQILQTLLWVFQYSRNSQCGTWIIYFAGMHWFQKCNFFKKISLSLSEVAEVKQLETKQNKNSKWKLLKTKIWHYPPQKWLLDLNDLGRGASNKKDELCPNLYM